VSPTFDATIFATLSRTILSTGSRVAQARAAEIERRSKGGRGSDADAPLTREQAAVDGEHLPGVPFH
jgi:hypothetical protein